MGACTMADALRGATGSGTMETGGVNPSIKFGIQGVTGPASYDTGGGSVASFASKGFTTILGAVMIADTCAAASIIRNPRYKPAAAGAPATGTILWQDGAAGANAETAGAVNLSTSITTWLVVGA